MTDVSVAYRLAPEHPAPAPVADGCVALSALLMAAAEWDDLEGLILCGDSAGAAIALAVESRADMPARARIGGVCSFFGGLGLFETPSMRETGCRADGLDEACVRRMWGLANGAEADSPYAIEALARPSGAPVYLLAGERYPLRDDTLGLASAYRACGRRYDLAIAEGVGHGFLHGAGAPGAAPEAMRKAGAWIRARCA